MQSKIVVGGGGYSGTQLSPVPLSCIEQSREATRSASATLSMPILLAELFKILIESVSQDLRLWFALAAIGVIFQNEDYRQSRWQ